MPNELSDIFAAAIAGGRMLQTPSDEDYDDDEYPLDDESELTPEQEQLLDAYNQQLDRALEEAQTDPLWRGRSGNRNHRSEEEKRHDLKLCGTVSREKINVKTGQLKARRFYCGQWQDGYCEVCAKRRRDRIRGRAMEGFRKATENDKTVKVLTCSEAQSKGYARQLGKEAYMRLPQGNDEVIMLMALGADSTYPGTIVDESALREMDWMSLSNTKDGNLSGNFGSNMVVSENTIEVETREVILDASLDIKKTAWLETLAESVDRQFTTEELLAGDTLQQVVNARMNAYVDRVVAAGGKIIKDWFSSTAVEISSIAWLSITAAMLEKPDFYNLIDGYDELKAVEWLRETRESSGEI